MTCLTLGLVYPISILVAIVATANHFILDAVAGAIVCCLGWTMNDVLLNLLVLEDWFLWCLKIHKPVADSFRSKKSKSTFGTREGWAPEKTLVMINAT